MKKTYTKPNLEATAIKSAEAVTVNTLSLATVATEFTAFSFSDLKSGKNVNYTSY